MSPPPVSVAVLTALDLEAAAVVDVMGTGDWVEHGDQAFFIGEAAGIGVAVVLTGRGNTRAALAAQQAIARWNPEYVLLAGIAGGLRGDAHRLGDVLVPDQVVGYEPGKIKAKGSERRYSVLRPSAGFLNLAREVAREGKWQKGISARLRKTDPEVHFGVVASGEKVISDGRWGKEFLAVWPQAVGVDMEAFGVGLAVYHSEELPEHGVVKAVSDFADAKKGDDWQAYAAASAAAFILALIKRMSAPSGRRPQPQRVGSPLSTHAPEAVRNGWGVVRVELCRRLSSQEAQELADCAEIPIWDQERHEGNLCRAVWNHLLRRDLLSELPSMLNYCLGRRDLSRLVLDWAKPS